VDASLISCLFLNIGANPDVRLLENLRLAILFRMTGLIDPEHPTASSKKEWDSRLILSARQQVDASIVKSVGGIIV
jgi:hypothetical protein